MIAAPAPWSVHRPHARPSPSALSPQRTLFTRLHHRIWPSPQGLTPTPSPSALPASTTQMPALAAAPPPPPVLRPPATRPAGPLWPRTQPLARVHRSHPTSHSNQPFNQPPKQPQPTSPQIQIVTTTNVFFFVPLRASHAAPGLAWPERTPRAHTALKRARPPEKTTPPFVPSPCPFTSSPRPFRSGPWRSILSPLP